MCAHVRAHARSIIIIIIIINAIICIINQQSSLDPPTTAHTNTSYTQALPNDGNTNQVIQMFQALSTILQNNIFTTVGNIMKYFKFQNSSRLQVRII
jgi:hypothetical protein